MNTGLSFAEKTNHLVLSLDHPKKSLKKRLLQSNITLLFSFLAFLVTNQVSAQTTVTITGGTPATATHNAGPIYRSSASSAYDASRYSYLFTAAELASAGIPNGAIITGIAWNKTNNAETVAGATAKFDIYLKNSSASAFSAASIAWATQTSGASLVYSTTTQTIPATIGWLNFPLSSNFAYSGGALEVSADWDINQAAGNPTTAALTWEISTVTDMIYGISNTTTPTANLSSTSNSISSLDNLRPNIQISFIASACTSPPTAGSAVSSSSTICAGSSFNLSLSGNSIGVGQTYQWEASTDGNSWSPISGATNPGLTTTQAATTYYRAQVTCSGSTVASSPVQVSTQTALSGAYIINSSTATSGRNYQSFTDAANALKCAGISGPVTFNVDAASGPYTEQIELTPISGANSTNTITFQGNGRTIQADPATGNRAVIKLNGADYVTINNLNITTTGNTTSSYGWGIHLMNGADYNTISNNTITINSTSTTESNSIGIVLVNSTSAVTTTGGDNGNNNTINGNTIIGGYKGIQVNNVVTSAGNNKIIGNTVRDFYSEGINVNGSNATLIEGNNISRNRASVTTFYGIYLGGTAQNTVVSKNRIHNTHDGASSLTGAAYGIYSTSNDAPVGSENIVKNNLIYNINNTGTAYAIYNSGSDGTYYYHNSVNLNNAASTGIARGFYQSTLAGNIKFINNNISITTGGIATNLQAIYLGTNTSTITSNNNNLYVPTGNVGYHNAINYATLTDWKTANSAAYDQNSVSGAAQFVTTAGGDNLMPSSSVLNSKGQNLTAYVADDFTGAARSSTPDLGAYEFTPSSLDLGVSALANPVASGCYAATENINITIQNFGTDPVDFSVNPVTVTANVTGAATQTLTATVNSGTLAPSATQNVSLGQLNMSAYGTYTFNANTATSGDGNSANDAITTTRTLVAPAALPQIIDFTGFTGANLNTVFPNWREAAGVSPIGTISTWVNSASAQTTAFGTTTAKINLYTTTRNEWMIGPKITPTATTALRFKVAITDYGSAAVDASGAMAGTDDKVQVMVSTDCGATFAPIYTFDASNTTTITNALTSQSISLAAYAGQNIIVAFYATDGPVDNTNDYDFHISDIFIGTPPSLDMGATVLVSPTTTSCYSATENIQVTIQNFGTNPIDFSTDPATVTVNVTGAVTQTLTATVNTGTLGAGLTQNVSVGTLDMRTVGGPYTFNGSTTVSGDGNTSNDAMVQATRTAIPLAALPQSMDFTGFTGSNLNTLFPNWKEASGATPAGTTSNWVSDDFGNVTGGANGIATKINLDLASDKVWITGPKVAATTGTKLKFDLALTAYNTTNSSTMGSDDELKVMISTDCGNTYTAIRTYNASTPISNSGQAETVDLAAYAGQDIMVAFFATEGSVDDAVDNDLFIDNVYLGTPPSLDMAATALVSPVSTGCFSAAEPVAVTILNKGNDPIDFSVNPTTVTVNVTGAVTQTITATVNTGTLAVGATQNVNVGNINMSAAGTFTFNGSATVSGDGNTANDAMSAATRTVTPVVALPEAIDFTGFTGSNLATVFPNWKEAAGTTPAGTTSAWTSSAAAQTTAFGSTSAKLNLFGTAKNEWIVGPKITPTSTTALKFKVAITDYASATVDASGAMAGTDDKVQVMVSTNCGATFTPIYTFDATNTTTISNTLKDQEISLAAYAGQNIMVAFYATDGPVDNTNDYDFHIDNISLGDCTPGLWTGMVSSEWNYAANWSCGTLPAATTDVTIPANAANFPVITSGTPVANNLTITSGALITLNAGTLRLNGNLTNNGTFAQTNGILELSGSGNQQIIGVSLINISINGSGTKTLGSDMNISGSMVMTNGIVNTAGFKLILGSTATLTESNTSYVIGQVETTRLVNSASTVDFGGMGLKLTPAASSVMPGSTLVRRVTGTQMNAGGPGSSIPRYFDIQATTDTGLNVAMVFSYLDHELAGFTENYLTLYRSADQGGHWNPKAATVVNTVDNTLTLNGISGFSYWTAGDINAPLPVELVSFAAVKKDKNALLSWTTAMEKDSKGFEIEVSSNQQQFRKIGFVESNNGTSMKHYTFTDTEGNKAGIRYYRLKQVDYDGTATYSEVKAVNFDNFSLNVNVYPNPFSNEVNLTLNTAEAKDATVILTDLTGKTVFTKHIKVEKGSNQFKLETETSLPSGAYLLNVQVGAERFTTKLLKQ